MSQMAIALATIAATKTTEGIEMSYLKKMLNIISGTRMNEEKYYIV